MDRISRYILVVGIPTAAIYSVLAPISADSGLSISTLVEGTGYMFLVLGWGCLILQPLAMQYGKRPIYLLSTLGTMVGNHGIFRHISVQPLTAFCIGNDGLGSLLSYNW